MTKKYNFYLSLYVPPRTEGHESLDTSIESIESSAFLATPKKSIRGDPIQDSDDDSDTDSTMTTEDPN